MSLSDVEDISSDPSDYSDLDSSNETGADSCHLSPNQPPSKKRKLSMDHYSNGTVAPPSSKRRTLETESLDGLLAKSMTFQPNLRWNVDGEWCRFCGARASVSFFTSPWGHRQLCFEHHTMWKQNKIDLLVFDEPQNIESAINKSECTERQYLIDLLMKFDNIDTFGPLNGYKRRSLRIRPNKLKMEQQLTYFGSDDDPNSSSSYDSSYDSSQSTSSSSDCSDSDTNTNTNTNMKNMNNMNIMNTNEKKQRRNSRKRLFRVYSCRDCEQSFNSPSLFKAHSQEIHKNKKPFECNECDKRYVDAGNLDYHIRKIHEKEINYHCEFCKKPFFDKTECKKHTKTHIKKKETKAKNFRCTHCNQYFKYNYYLKKHIINIHLPNKDKPYQCTYCTYGAATKWQIRIHEDIHRNERQYKCPHCHRGFNNKKNCEHHVLNAHLKPFKCPQCHKGFGSKAYVETHIIAMHTNNEDKPYQCRYCDYGSAKKKTVEKHELLHANQHPFTCGICGKAFKLLSYLHTHMDRVHVENEEKRYQCNVCQKRFHHKRYFKFHEKSHSLNSDSNAIHYYECDKCEYSTPSEQRLEKHQEIHSGEKPFECDICGKTFRLEHYVKSHKMNMHFRKKN